MASWPAGERIAKAVRYGGPSLQCVTVYALDLGSRRGLVRKTEGYDRLLTCMSEDMQLDFAASGELVTVARRSDFVWQCRGLDVDVKGCTGALGDVGKQHAGKAGPPGT